MNMELYYFNSTVITVSIVLGIIAILALLFIIIINQNTIMNVNDQIKSIVSDINDSTNNIAADLENIKKKLETDGVTPETLAELSAAADKLKEVAASTPDEDTGSDAE